MGDQTIIATCAGVTFACIGLDKLDKSEVPSGRFIAASCLAFAGLGLIAMVSSDIGKGLAIAVAGTAFATSGAPLLVKQFPESKPKRKASR